MQRTQQIKRVLYKKSEQAQRIPHNFVNPEFISAVCSRDDEKVVVLTYGVDTDENEIPLATSEVQYFNIAIKTRPMNQRRAATARCLASFRTRAGVCYHIYEMRVPRRGSKDFLYHELKPGINSLDIDGGATVNVKCPLRIMGGKPFLVYKSDLRRRIDEALVAILVDFTHEHAVTHTAQGRGLMKLGRGQTFPMPEEFDRRYELYVSTVLCPDDYQIKQPKESREDVTKLPNKFEVGGIDKDVSDLTTGHSIREDDLRSF